MTDEKVLDTADTADNSTTEAADTTETVTTDDNAGGQGKPTKAQETATNNDESTVVPDWPDDWRDKLSKGDEKLGKRLARFQSPADILKSFQALEQKMSSGDLKSTLPENATDEQIAAYRKENGIPEKPEGYLESLPNGLVIGDEDKDLVNSFVERVHGKNADPAIVSEALDWYYSVQEQQIEAQAVLDGETMRKNEDEMRVEWGNDYRPYINAIENFLDTAPAADDGTPLRELLLGSRLSDGTPIGNHPAVMRWLQKLSSDANPAGFIAPGVGGSQSDSVRSEIDKIENFMRTDRAAYNKDTEMQARLRALYDAEEKLSA